MVAHQRKSRLDRETLHKYSTDTKIRAAEELIAELDAAFLGAALGLPGSWNGTPLTWARGAKP